MQQIHKCTLVPSRYFNEEDARCILHNMFRMDAAENVYHVDEPQFDAVLVYSSSNGEVPIIHELLGKLGDCREYNKIIASVSNGNLDLVIAQGGRLLLANSYPAPDFVTAQYFIFLSMKMLQLNPEVSVISLNSDITAEEELSLYRYFKSVERI